MIPNITLSYPMIPLRNKGTFGPFTICALMLRTANVNVVLIVVYQTLCICIWSLLLSCCFSLVNASLRKFPDPIQIVLDSIPGAHANHPEESQVCSKLQEDQKFHAGIHERSTVPCLFAMCQCNARNMPSGGMQHV